MATADPGYDVDGVILTGNETVLVVEDEADLRQMVIDLLESIGYRVLAAKDGPTALVLIEGAESIDLLLSDVVLPAGPSGADLAEIFERRFPDSKVILCSGYPRDLLRRQGRYPENMNFLGKPYRIADLVQRIRQTLDA